MTTWWGWALRRARAATGLLLTLLALVTATTAILAGAVGYSGAAATTAAREALTGATPAEAGIRVQTRQAEDPAAQDAAATRIIEDSFDAAPVTIRRTVVGEPRVITRDGGPLEGKVVVMSSPSLTPEDASAADRVEITDGDWPAQTAEGEPVQGLLHAATADEWEVGVGDSLTVGGTEITVTGLWRPVEASDPSWFGDPLVAAGKVDDTRGPLVVPPGVVAQVVDRPFVRWTVQPDATLIQPDDLASLATAAAQLQGSLKVPEVEVNGVTVEGDLAPTAATASTNLRTAAALGVIPLSVLALVTVLAITQLARLLSSTREAQAQLLVARGANRTQVLLTTVAESAVVTVVGTALGGLLAWGVLQAVPAGDAQGPTVVRVALATGAVILLVLIAVAVLQLRRLTAAGALRDLSGRTRAATALATVVLVLGAAGVAWWQLRRNGSPLITREDGTLGTDLVAGAAPALLLAAAAVVAMALLGPVTRIVEAVTRPGRAAAGHLAASQVSRRLTVYAVPAVLTVLAVGATTLAALYAGTSATLRSNLASVAEGAPVRAVLDPPPVTVEPGLLTPPVEDFSGTPGVAASTLVWLDPNGRLADVSVPLTMGDAEELATIVPSFEGVDLVPPEAISAATGHGRDTGVPIPEGTSTVTVELDTDLTVAPEVLEQFQTDYEMFVEQMQNPDQGDPLSEEEARRIAREVTDDSIKDAVTEQEWTISATFVDAGSGMLQTVTGATEDGDSIRVDLPVVEPPAPDQPVDYAASTITQGSGTGVATFTLPEGTTQILRSVHLEAPILSTNSWSPISTDVDLTLTARTDDGTALFGEATQAWGSAQAAPPELVAERQAQAEESDQIFGSFMDPATGQVYLPEDSVYVPAELDTSGESWRLRGNPHTNLPIDITVGAHDEWVDPTVIGQFGDRERVSEPEGEQGSAAVPIVLTTSAAEAADLSVGSPARINAFGTGIPVTVAAVVPAVPGTLTPEAGLLDRDTVLTYVAAEERALPYPTEVWATTEEGQEDAVVESLSTAPTVARVTGPGSVSITDAASAARLVFWVASAGAVLLAMTGIAAVAATLLTQRRPEVAVLRALGMPPRTQARSRALELGGVVLASVLLGLAAGWLVGRAVVPDLARSTTLRGQVQLPTQLVLEPGLWALLLGIGALAVLAIILVQAASVARQALDADYREEIR